MSVIVCQGLQSCLEPGFLEPRAIIDKLASPRSNVSQSIPWSQKTNPSQEQKDNSWNENENFNKIGDDDDGEKQSNNGGDSCWSILQTLSSNNSSQSEKEAEEEQQVYVHPLAKRSLSTLSTQSLEMCTEGLGSETGSNSDEIMADLSCLSYEIQSSGQGGIQQSRSREYLTKKLERNGTFPPPLTLISGSEGIQLRPHREGGRLVLKAVAFSHKSCFQAERIDGRLRLFSLSNDGYTNYDEEISQSEELEHENIADEEQNFREEYTDSHACDGDDENNSSSEEEGMEGSGGILECEIDQTEEFPRPSRCKEEDPRNRGLNWEQPFWVAIS